MTRDELPAEAPGPPATTLALLASELEVALHDHVRLEQATGVLAERAQLSLDEALHCIEKYARHHNLPRAAVCAGILDGTFDGIAD